MEDRVKRILLGVLDVEETDIVFTASLVNDLGADSVDLVELVQRLEREFQASIPDSDLAAIETVGDLVRYLHPLPASGSSDQ